jgi:shikimate dehydrogenase
MKPLTSDSQTKLYGVIGDPVAHSLSPVMLGSAFRQSGYNGVYLAFRISDIKAGVEAIRVLGIRGVSVTIPHKLAVMEHLDRVEKSAREIGAVNTIVNSGGNLEGHNTDCHGAITALSRKTDLKGRRVTIVGAGGAARAIGFGVRSQGGRVTIVNRSDARGKALANDLGADYCPMGEIGGIESQVLVNTTPVGMFPHTKDMPVDEKYLKKGMVVMDIVYNPLETAFLKAARQKGCEIIDGVSMFVHQGAAQFSLWTGRKAPVELMQKVVYGALGNGN